MEEAVIVASGLSKTFQGGSVAVKNLDLEVRRGSVCGLVGRITLGSWNRWSFRVSG